MNSGQGEEPVPYDPGSELRLLIGGGGKEKGVESKWDGKKKRGTP